ncbi:MAG: TetM/TetW/TetO/TetS family tetracycline resistance ribosomal protection protein [Lachnospiraceae bacterium]|nr:TetM/TetW/TetO/TetS family tetracycline resistance ribosomal protection protein [Lachnospiraceae bacterium]
MKHINLGIVAHVDAGKTTLTEAMLYKSGILRKLGRVDERNTFLDTDEQERERGITIYSKQAQLMLGDLHITLVDTPGHVDFSAEAECVLQVLDYCIIVVSASDGVKGHTLTLWSLLNSYGIPVFIFVNKMDQPGALKNNIMEVIKKKLNENCFDMSGQFKEENSGNLCFTREEAEDIVMSDETLMEEYIEKQDPEILNNTRITCLIKERRFFPVFFGSALRGEGINELINGLKYLTLEDIYPEAFGARVFKITRDSNGNRLTHLKVTGGSLKPKALIGEEKINQLRLYSGEKFETLAEARAGEIVVATGLNNTRIGMGLGALNRENTPVIEPVLCYRVKATDGTDAAVLLSYLRLLEDEDPQLVVEYNENTKETEVRVMGEVQLQVLTRTLKDRFGCDVFFDTGGVLYKETIGSAVEGVGHFEPLRHYAEVHLLLTPLQRGSGISYDTVCSEDILNRNWQRLILTHLKERIHKGVLTGSPIADMKITLLTGKASVKHTEGGDFRQATYRALRQGLMSTASILLEPYYYYRIELPAEFVGRAMTDLERMNGKPSAPEPEGDMAVLTGRAPVVCIRNYSAELTAYSKGLGSISLSLAGYDECHNPDEVVESIGYLPEADVKNTPDSVFCAHGAGFIVPWDKVREYMHVESPKYISLDGKYADLNYEAEEASGSVKYNTIEKGDLKSQTVQSIGTDEIDAILNRTFYSNSDSSIKTEMEKRKGVGAKKGKVVSTGGKINDPYSDYKYNPIERKKKYMIVDGYNVIFAFSELKSLAAVNLDAARDRFIDIMSNLQGAIDAKIILVFDAYKVKGRTTDLNSIMNIKVVFTAEDETADSYIERFAAENGRKYDVTVVTSDKAEGSVAYGSNCHLMSARALEGFIDSVIKNIMDDFYAGNREEKVRIKVDIEGEIPDKK